DATASLLGVNAGARDALQAVAALLHHAAPSHRHLGVLQRLEALELAVRVLQEVEAPDLVRAVVRAEARADAAVVDLHVEALAVMHRGAHRAHELARRALAVHAGHGLEDAAPGRGRVVAVDADPVHHAAQRYL